MSWKTIADWAKHKPLTLRLADRLGRSRGRLGILNHVNPPAAAPITPDISDWADRDLSAVWLGHATLLIRIGGKTILTDPVFVNRVGVGFGLFTGGPKRLVAPALSIRELPPIDLILLSHAHFDHLDRPTLARLPTRTPIITSGHTRDLVTDIGFRRVTELRWGESLLFDTLRVTARQVRHWGARTFRDDHRGFNAYLIESTAGPPRRVLYGGDTAYQDYFRDIGRVDLAILGIGGYNPWLASHANPEQAWEMANHLNADYLLPMHHSTFRLSYEPRHEPMERLLTAAGGGVDRIVVRQVGGGWKL